MSLPGHVGARWSSWTAELPMISNRRKGCRSESCERKPANMLHGPAMTMEQAVRSLRGIAAVEEEAAKGWISSERRDGHREQ